MIVTAALLAYAAVVALVAPWVLSRVRWVDSVPRMGILAWQSAMCAVLGAGALLVLAAALPVERVSFDVGHLLHACAVELSRGVGSGWQLLRAGAAVVASLIVVRLLWALGAQVLTLHRQRSRLRDQVSMLAAAGPDGELVIDSDLPLAFCIPGAGGRVVLTRGAAALLDPAQRSAVLAHERAHLHARHDLVLLGADVAASALGFLGFFRAARAHLRELVELLADDAAARRFGALPVATALAGLGGGQAPDGAVHTGATAHLKRIDRLLDRGQTPSGPARVAVVVSLATIALLPWVIAVGPAWTARYGFCLSA